MAGTSRNWALIGRLLYAPLTLGAGAVVAYTDAFQRLRGIWHELPSELRWGLLGALALAAVAVVAVLASKKSVLRRPERFRVTPHDPRYLVGREQEIEDLCSECESQGLVFLVGESGAGKSSLIDAGLFPRYAKVAENQQAPPFVPILIDASGLAWEDGLKQDLSRKIRSLNSDQLRRIGADSSLAFDDAFAFLASLPAHAPSKLLLVLDQIDDYLLEHSKHFLHRRKVISPERLMSSNPDWELLRYAIETKRVHAVIVGRNDAVMLDALQISTYTKFVLTRLDPHLIRPLFELVTQPDAGGDVVEFPANGWNQLKARLLRDLSASGQVLPMQLVIALDSLRRLRYLTTSAYHRCGGILGLERLYIERHVADICREAGLERARLLKALRKLTTDDGAKTCRLRRQEFIAAAFDGQSDTNAALPLVDHLVRTRVIRTQTGRDGESVMLYHDYLARGVVEAYRHANRWTEKLKIAARELEVATSLPQRWRALLPIQDLAAMVVARLGGRFRFGEYRKVASLSTLRFIPIIVICLALLAVERRISGVQERQRTAELVAQIAADGDNHFDAEAWEALSLSSQEARAHACLFALSRPALARSIRGRAGAFAHTLVGFDPSSQTRRRLAIEAILPALSAHAGDADVIRAAGAITKELALPQADLLKIVESLARCLSISTSDATSSACNEQLRELAEKLDPDSACQIGALVAKNARFSPHYGLSDPHTATLQELLSVANGRNCHIVIQELVRRMKDDDQHERISHVLDDLFREATFEKSAEYVAVVRDSIIEAGNPKDLTRAGSFARILPRIAGCVPVHLAEGLREDIAIALGSATNAVAVSAILKSAIALGLSSSPQVVDIGRTLVIRHLAVESDDNVIAQLLECGRVLGGAGDSAWARELATAVSEGIVSSGWNQSYHPRCEFLISALPDLESKDREQILAMMSNWIIPNPKTYSLPSYHDDDLLSHLGAVDSGETSTWRRRNAETCLGAIVTPPPIVAGAGYTDIEFCIANATAIRRFRDQLSDAETASIKATLLSRSDTAPTLNDRISLRGEYIAVRQHAESQRDAEWAAELSRRLLDGLESGEAAAAKPAFEIAVAVCQDSELDLVGDSFVQHIRGRRPLGQLSVMLEVVCAKLPEPRLDELARSLADRLLEGNPDEVVAELHEIGGIVWPLVSHGTLRRLGKRAIDSAASMSSGIKSPYAASLLLQILPHLPRSDVQELWPEILQLTNDHVLWPGEGLGAAPSAYSLKHYIDNLDDSAAVALCDVSMRVYSDNSLSRQLVNSESVICKLLSRMQATDRVRVSEWAAERVLVDMRDFRLISSFHSDDLLASIPQQASKRLIERLFIEGGEIGDVGLMSIHTVVSSLRRELPYPDALRLMNGAFQRFRASAGTFAEPWHGAMFGHFLGYTNPDTVMEHLPFVLECIRSERDSIHSPHLLSIASGAVEQADSRSRPALIAAVLERMKRDSWDSRMYSGLLVSLVRGSPDAVRREVVCRVAYEAVSEASVRGKLSGCGKLFHENLRHLLPEEQADIASSLLRFLAHRRFDTSVRDYSMLRVDNLSPLACDFVAESLVELFQSEASAEAKGRWGTWGDRDSYRDQAVRERVLDEWISVQNRLDPSRALEERLQVRLDALNLPTHSLVFHPRIIGDASRVLAVEFSGDRFELLNVLAEKGVLGRLQLERVRH